MLDKVAVYLKEPPLLPVELGAHTDIRGTDEYNMDLSAKRADSVVKYLISKGVPATIISAKGYGKTKLIHKGDHISEALHQENRRTTLRFKLFENDAKALVHDVIAPSYKMPATFRIDIEGFTRKGCHKTKDHLDKIISYDSYQELDSHSLKRDKPNDIILKLHSRISTIPKITDALVFGISYKNIYHYYLHSCTYYSITKNPTLVINAYPDIVWIGHFQYNYMHQEKNDENVKAPYYFHNKAFELKNGIEQEITEISNSLFGKLMFFLPNGWLAKEVFLPYVQKQAKIYDVGLHAIFDRKLEKRGEALNLKGTELDFIKTNNTTRYIAAYIIYEFVALGIIIDLLMLYFTRGKSAESKLAKIVTKVKKISKYINDAGAELVPSSIAINTGMYYKMMADRRISLILEANIKADPLVAINYEKKYTLKSLLFDNATKEEKDQDKQKKNKAISDALSKIGKNDIMLTLHMCGEINLEQNLQYNVLTEQYSLKDQFSALVENNSTTYSKKIKGSISLDGDYSRKFFEFSPLETKVNANISLKVDCEAILISKFGYDKKNGKGLYLEQILKFSGLKGTFTGSIQAKNDDLIDYDYSPNNGEPIDFIIFKDKTIILNSIQLFQIKQQN
nr:OmpA family protein [Flavobacterium humidisoli]